MLGIKVPLGEAQKVKRYLLKEGLYDKHYKPRKTAATITFPLAKQDSSLLKRFLEAEIKEAGFEKIASTYKQLLPEGKEMPGSYDIVGDIIIVEIKDGMKNYEKEIGKALLESHKNVSTVLKKADIHKGEFRTQRLKHLAGKKKKETVHRENNVLLKLDVEKTYFSSRLGTERKRIFKQVKPKERVLVMFSGVGVYPIVISKNTGAAKIIGIEKNPAAHKYGVENIKLNKVGNVELHKGDVRKIIPELKEKFDRIIMPLPKQAGGFLDVAARAWKKGTRVHLYGFSHENTLGETAGEVKEFCMRNKINYKILRTVKCGQYSPGKYRVCVDFMIK